MAAVVDRVGMTAVAAECAEVGHPPFLPQKRMLVAAARLRRADNIAAVVDRIRLAVAAAERAEVVHPALLPQEGMRRAIQIATEVAGPNNVAAVVYRVRVHPAVLPPERPEVAHLALLPHERPHNEVGIAAPPLPAADDVAGTVDS